MCCPLFPHPSFLLSPPFSPHASRLDHEQLNNVYRYKTEEYSHTAVNKFNVIPDSIPDWLFDFMPLKGGYFIGNVSPARMDFRSASQPVGRSVSAATPWLAVHPGAPPMQVCPLSQGEVWAPLVRVTGLPGWGRTCRQALLPSQSGY